MTKEELKALGLTDEQADKVLQGYADFVPKDEFEQQKTALQQAKDEQKRVSKELDALKKANANNEDLTKQIEKMKEDAAARQKEYDTTIKQMRLDAAVDKSLLTAKAKNAKAVKALLNLTDAEVGDDGNVKGLDDQLKKLQESDAYLFDLGSQKKTIEGLKAAEGADNVPNTSLTDQEIFEKALFR